MKIAPNFRSISLGSLAVFAGYALCTFFLSALSLVAAPRVVWLAMVSIASLFAASSGFIGALFAPRNPILNGVLGGFVGATLLLLARAAIGSSAARFVFVVPLLSITLLAFIGALLAVYAWPRRVF